MKAISAVILFFIAAVIGVALYDTPENVLQGKHHLPADVSKKKKASAEKQLTVQEKKQRFIDATLPAILRVKAELDDKYAHVLRLSKKKTLSLTEQSFIDNLKHHYKVDGIPCLLNRLRTHPTSIVLAQAALETGWGTSRFYTEANNIFGIWSYNKREPRMAASETRGEKTIYVKKYATLDDSIRGYFKMMATGHAYKSFRHARKQEQNPFRLLAHLTHYSELREEYVKRLYTVIKANRFYQFDEPVYAPIKLAEIIPDYVKRQKALKEAAMLAKAAESDRPASTLPVEGKAPHIEERRDTEVLLSSDCNNSQASTTKLIRNDTTDNA